MSRKFRSYPTESNSRNRKKNCGVLVGNLPLMRLRPPIFNDLNTRVPHVGVFGSSHVHNLLIAEDEQIPDLLIKEHPRSKWEDEDELAR
ncbi:hypothetical protein RND71_024037 [Anisodus tanguticus]|uniref:Uncharacterized protein n=1 Tax=Anisodus tanguticus TaxID=243964 RepID=A0AAE1RNT4_9SOLA|nr:hypothetical protein RND71_024037 [Anisodus tanguticus]